MTEDVFAEENTGSKEDAAKRERRRQRDVNDLRVVLKIPEGRRYIWKLWGITGVFRASYTPKDANYTAFKEGQRDIGLALLSDINDASPTALAQMRSEYLSEKNQEVKKKEEDNGE
jgi:hypothetical protein